MAGGGFGVFGMSATHLGHAPRRGARLAAPGTVGRAAVVLAGASAASGAGNGRSRAGAVGLAPPAPARLGAGGPLALGRGTGGAPAAVSSHSPDQLPSLSAMRSLAAAATSRGNSIMATWPASGSVSRREPRKALDALRAMRNAMSWSRPP